jgi:hypothetical protein
MSLRDLILTADDLPREAVHCPEWKATVYVRTMTGEERDAFEQSQMEKRGKDEKQNLVGIRARLAVICACDKDGNAIFGESDIPALSKKSAKALNRIFNKASALNGFTGEDVEELAKNSESGQSAASISA